jgi:cytochrome c biogenesis protein CcdA
VSAAALAAAFAGGVLALLAPCSALLLPAFFAYACANVTSLLRATGLFLLGLCVVLLPLGLAASLVGQLLIEQRQLTILAAGGLLAACGAALLVGRGISIGPRLAAPKATATFATGVVYGLTGYCSGPLLGGVLTLAAVGHAPVVGALLLVTYAVGMTAPLLVLATLWDHYHLGQRAWLRRSMRYSTVLGGALFIALGLTFILSQGGLLLSGVYDDLGLTDLGARLQDWIITVFQL